MKRIILILVLICLSSFVLAEEKSTIGIVPKLTAEEKKDAPTIVNSEVYPFWGVPCTNYTYYAVYKDEKGREPEYMRIWLNGNWHDMELLKGDPKTGATYVYYYVPTSGKTNFYYYEASNGVGKARGSMIDSPDNGPVLFSEKLDNNEIVLLDKDGKEVWSYPTGKDWVEGVAISKDGDYIAAITNFYIYLFSKDSKEPLWSFCMDCKIPDYYSGTAAGVAISADGTYIAADMQGTLYFFNRESNQPLWTKNTESGAIGVDMSDDGSVIAVGAGGKIFIFDKEGNKLGEYKPSHPDYEQTGEFYQPDVTPDGKYVAISTGCPDRRAYLFSGEGDLSFRSDQLTYDSPVHKSAISDDSSLIAYSADHSQGKEIVFLFDNKGKKLWGFSSSEDGTARAVSISGDGNYVAAGTGAGHVYLFSKDSNKPKWKFTAPAFFSQIGDIKLNQDGSLLAAGGTTKKVYLFSKNSNKPLWEYQANTWITKIDFNGEYIVAGTGPREYFFEGNSLPPDEIQCKEIIQPPPMGESLGKCGDGKCIDPQENYENCPQDCCPLTGCGENDMGEFEAVCGDGMCNEPQESYENCPQDCCPPTGCEDDLDNLDYERDNQEDSFCSEFDGNREACYAYPDECNWIINDEICGELGELVIEDIIDGMEEPTGDVEEKSFFGKIIDWFKGLFGK